MITYTKESLSVYTTKQLYDLVLDIEKYPEFLPWCVGARINNKNNNELSADLLIKFKIFRESYTSRVVARPPEGKNGQASIDVFLEKGPFSHLQNNWIFSPVTDVGESKSQVKFAVSFSFKKEMLNSLIGPLFKNASSKMVQAFETRASVLYKDQDFGP